MSTSTALIDPALRPVLTMTADECLDTAAAWEHQAVEVYPHTPNRRVQCEANAGIWLNRALQGGYEVPR